MTEYTDGISLRIEMTDQTTKTEYGYVFHTKKSSKEVWRVIQKALDTVYWEERNEREGNKNV